MVLKKKLCGSLVEANESLLEAITMGKITSGKKMIFKIKIFIN
jgi:hypothetical protein